MKPDVIEERLLVLPKQREMLAYTKKWGAARGGQRAGKTTSWVYWLLSRMEAYPEANAVVVGATYQQLRDGIFGTIQDTLWKHGYEDGVDFRYSGSPRPWIKMLDTGAKLHSWSAEIVARVRSANVQTLVLEEPQTWGPQAVSAWESLSGRLTHNERTASLYPDLEPQGRMSFNPSGVGPGHWLYELIEKRWAEEGYKCWQVSVRENSLLLKADPGYVRNLEVSISPERWAVEIDGEYSTMGGGVYRRYDYGVHHRPPETMPALTLDPSKPLLFSMDFNVGLMCSVIAQAHMQPTVSVGVLDQFGRTTFVKKKALAAWQERIFYFIDEMALPDSGVEDIVPEFLRRYGDVARRNGVYIYGDPAGGNRNQIISGRNPIKTNWMRIYADLRAAGIPYTRRVVQGAVHPNDHVNMVNMQLNSGPGPEPQSGFGMVIDEHRCPELLEDFRMVTYIPGTNKVEKKTSPPSAARRTHAADAAGYLLYVERAMMFERKKFEWQMDR